MFPRRELFFATVSLAVLFPAVAYACGGAGMAIMILAIPLLAAAIIPPLSCIAVASVSSFLEGYRGVRIDKPSWWKTRLWAVGLGGFMAACALPIAVAFGLQLLGVSGLPFDIFFIVIAFIATAPLVVQTAYAARTWQKSTGGG